MNNIEEYQNLVGLLKNALKFYANEDNYLFYNNKDAPVALDNGSQARFALKKIEEASEASDKMEADYVKNLTEAIENNNNTEDMLKIIEEFKNLGNADNNI